MPLSKIEVTGNQRGWAIWFINESEEELAFQSFEQCPEEIISKQKRLEWLAGRALLNSLLAKHDLTYSGTSKDDFGKPFLKDLPHHISLSHSYPYVAAQLDLDQSVGVDLEQPKEKLLIIAARILSPSELFDAGEDVVKHCIYWCAKESLYKIDGKRGLHFSNQLNLEPFTLQKNGELKGIITTKEQKLSVNLIYQVESDYVFVHTKTS